MLRAFSPPRIETADYAVRSRDAVLRSAAPAARPHGVEAAGPAPFSGRAAAQATAADEFGSARVRELQETNARLMSELTGIRGMIERQLAGFAWGETRRQAPARATMLGELLEAGFSSTVARKLCEAVREDADRTEARATAAALQSDDGIAAVMRPMPAQDDSDLVLVDKASGVVFAGGLVFADRVPTTPHANLARWLASYRPRTPRPFPSLNLVDRDA